MRSMLQFVSHVSPPSCEKAWSHRHVVSVKGDQMKRTRIALPSNLSSPKKSPRPSLKLPISGGSSLGFRLSLQ